MIHPTNFNEIRPKYEEIVGKHEDYVNEKKANLHDGWQELQKSRIKLEKECDDFISMTNTTIKINGGMKTKEIDAKYKKYLKDVEGFKDEYHKDYDTILENTKLNIVTRVTLPGK